MSNLGSGLKNAALDWLLADKGRRIVAFMCALFVLVLLTCTLRSTGITDDDDFYAPAGIAYAGHFGRVLSLDFDALSQSQVDRAFNKNKEHPPLAKFVMGASYYVLHQWTGLLPALDAARFGVVLLAVVLAYLLASFAHLWRGPIAAVVAVLALFSLPRFFFHSHVATLDAPVATLYFATAYAFWRARSCPVWAVATGVIFALAALTKLNAPFAFAPIFVFVLLESWRQFRSDSDGHFVLPKIPGSLISMVLLGPILFVVLWPHLWFDTFQRIGEYVGFHLNHYPIYLYYFGQIYNKPFAPWHTPFVLFFATTPLLLFAAFVGGLASLRGLKVFLLGRRESEDYREGSLAWYVLLHLFTTIGIVAFLGSPKYGGVKLFLPFFPFVALLVGVAVDTAVQGLKKWRPQLAARGDLVAVAVGCLIILPPAVATLSNHPFGLSYYSATVGGLRGATAIGFERQYYDVADKELAAWFNQNAAKGATVHFEPNNKEYVKTYRWLARDGYLRSDIRVVGSTKANYLVLTHERRWASYPGLLAQYASYRVATEKKIDGVPLYTVFQGR